MLLCYATKRIPFLWNRGGQADEERLLYLCTDKYTNFKVNRLSSKWKSQLYRNKRWKGRNRGRRVGKKDGERDCSFSILPLFVGVRGSQDGSCKEYLVLFP